MDGFQGIVVGVVVCRICGSMIASMGDGKGCLIGRICLDEVIFEGIPIVVVGIFGDREGPIDEGISVLIGHLNFC